MPAQWLPVVGVTPNDFSDHAQRAERLGEIAALGDHGLCHACRAGALIEQGFGPVMGLVDKGLDVVRVGHGGQDTPSALPHQHVLAICKVVCQFGKALSRSRT